MPSKVVAFEAMRTRWVRERTHWLFFACCMYLATQVFTIPILAKGPWAVWPTLSDIALAMMVFAGMRSDKRAYTPSAALRTATLMLALAFIASVISFGVFVVFPYLADPTNDELQGGFNFGIYQIYRLIQFALVFKFTKSLPLDTDRRITLQKVSVTVLVLVCLGIILSYFSILPQRLLVAHLPHGYKAAGAWADFTLFNGMGTIGYNHGYVALQVMILLGFALHFMPSGKKWYIGMLVLMAFIAVVCTGSRAGIVGTGLYACYLMLRRPRYLIISISLLAVLFSVVPHQYLDEMIPALKRSSTISSSYQADGFAGRSEIWQYTVTYLQEHPERLIIGCGFGLLAGRDAHNNFLEVLFEFGVIGLAFFLALIWVVLKLIYQYETGLRSLFWMTLALLITALTQETFYPVVSFGHFLGLYLFTLAIVLHNPQATEHENAVAANRPIGITRHDKEIR